MADPNIPQILYNIAAYLGVLVVGWVAYELRALRKEIHERVHKTECDKDMGAHCKRIETVEVTAQENKTEIAIIKSKLRMEGTKP